MPEESQHASERASHWPSLSIVVPCYNEFDRLDVLHHSLVEFSTHWPAPLQLILVDDGSTDTGFEKMQSLFVGIPETEVLLLRYAPNRGKGYALRHGVLQAVNAYTLTMDADVATPPSMILQWFQSPQAIGPETIYIGSREHRMSRIKVPGTRKWSGRLFNLFTRISSGLPYLDTQCGFKWYPTRYAQSLFDNLITFGWAHDIELLWKARKAGWKIQEMPVDWDHQDNSKIRLLSDGWKMGIEVIRLRWYFWKKSLQKAFQR
ncbi:MAG: glycosyltransferase [Saprospiraceae bacterium]